MSDGASISPRGIPPIRTDWLADVAWRLATIGLERLRALGTEPIVATDVVDGERWRLAPARWSDPSDVVVELDGDVFLPTDDAAPTLRLGVAVTPRFDDVRGRLLEVRIEIGPRGAVTFDPENWIYAFELAAIERGERPAVPGVEAGEFTGLPAGDPEPSVAAADLAQLDLGPWLPTPAAVGALVAIAEGRASWTATLGLLHPAPRRGLLRRREWRAVAVLTLTADGPITVDPADPLTAAGFEERQVLDLIDGADGTVLLTVDGLEVPDGRITTRGEGLRASLHRIADR